MCVSTCKGSISVVATACGCLFCKVKISIHLLLEALTLLVVMYRLQSGARGKTLTTMGNTSAH